MPKRLAQFATAAVIALAAACGSDTNAVTVSCDMTALCIDYGNGINPDAKAALSTACQSSGGTLNDAMCRTTGRIGTCTFAAADGVPRLLRVYPAAGMTAAQSEQACQSGQLSGSANVAGTWTAG